MASFEPGADVLRTLTTVGAILDWVQIAGELRAQVLSKLDVEEASPARTLAAIAEQDLLEARATMQVNNGGLTPSAKGKVVHAWQTSRLASGVVKTKAEVASVEQEKREILKLQAQADATKAQAASTTTASPSSSITGLGQVNLAETIDQTLSGTVPLLPEKDLIKLEAVYEERCEGPCPAGRKPSDHQLSALFALLMALLNPYCDFAIFGPFQNRLRRKLVFFGLVPDGNGNFRKVEIRGPPDIETWTSAFHVFRAAMLMLKAASMAALDRYLDYMWKLAKDYGSRVWHLQYQADVRFRLEELPKLRRQLIKESEEVTKGGGTHPFEADRPWLIPWKMATTSEECDRYWRREFIDPATMVRLELKKLGEVVDGDAPVGNPGDTAARAVAAAAAADSSLPDPPQPHAAGRPKRPVEQPSRWPIKENKKSKMLCPDFNVGCCQNGQRGSTVCPLNMNLRHQCGICLGGHAAIHCDGSGPLGQHPSRDKGKGEDYGGRGRGAGRGIVRKGKGGRGAGRGTPWRRW